VIRLRRGIPQSQLLDAVREFGEPFGYEEERGGALIHDVRPEAGYEGTQSSKGRAEFHAHTDCTFLPARYRPEFLSLYCISNEAKAATLLWPVETLIAAINEKTLRILGQSRFVQHAPLTFGLEKPISAHRVLDGNRIAYSAQGTRSTDDETAAALAVLENTIQQTEPTRIVLEPGDLLVFSNQTALHGREEIRGERWLRRIYLRRDVSALRKDAATNRPNVFQASAVISQPALR